MSTSQPRQRWACPECGAALEADVRQCWLCYREVEPVALAANAATPTGADRPPSAAKAANGASPFAPGAAPHYERHAYFQFTISSMLLLTTLVAVLCGVGSMEPGLGIALAIIAAPALLRTWVVAVRRRASGEPVSPLGKVAVFALSLATVVVIIVASAAAFFFSCLSVVAGSQGRGSGMEGLALLLGGVAGIGVAAVLIWAFWFRRWRGRR